MQYQKDLAIVLSRRQLSDNKKLVTLFTKYSGKIIATSHGASKINSSRLAHFEPGNFLTVEFSKNIGGFISIKESKIIYSYSGIRASENKTKQLFLLCFVFSHLLPENLSETTLFDKSLSALKLLNNTNTNMLAHLRFSLQTLGYTDHEDYILEDKLENILSRSIPNFNY